MRTGAGAAEEKYEAEIWRVRLGADAARSGAWGGPQPAFRERRKIFRNMAGLCAFPKPYPLIQLLRTVTMPMPMSLTGPVPIPATGKF